MAGQGKFKGPGTAGKKGLKSLKKFKQCSNPNVKEANKCQFEWFDDDQRKSDLSQNPKGSQQPRKLEAQSIMQNVQKVFQPPQGKVTDYIKKFDKENKSGAIKNHLDVLDKLLKKGDSQTASLTGMLGGGMMQSIQQSINEQKGRECPPGQRFDETKQKCVLDCPRGFIWDEATQTCIIDEGNYEPNNDPNTGSPDIIIVTL